MRLANREGLVDFQLARATSTFKFSTFLFRGVAEAALYCAHRATTVSSWGLCEQEGHLATPRSLLREQRTGTGVVATLILVGAVGDLLAEAGFFETDFSFFDF